MLLRETQIKKFFNAAYSNKQDNYIDKIITEKAYIQQYIGQIETTCKNYCNAILNRLQQDPATINISDIESCAITGRNGILSKSELIKQQLDCIQDNCLTLKKYNGEYFEQYEKFKKEIKLIEKHKSCKYVHLDNENYSIRIQTEPIIMHEPKTEKNFFLGEMEINIPTNPCFSIHMFNENQRTGYDGQSMNHPHVFNNGEACFGNINSQIALYQDSSDYYALYLLLLSFLKTCNIEDEAGRFVASWDECDEHGNIIDVADVSQILLEDGRKLDDWCICDNCDRILSLDQAFYCTLCNRPICEDCVETHNGRSYCDYCYSEMPTCLNCGDLIDIDNDDYGYDERGNLICGDCMREKEEEEENAKLETA